jgi:hypothetical protein
MKYIFWLIILILPVLVLSQNDLTADQIANRAQEAIKVKGVQAVSVMRIVDEKGRERIRKIKQVAKLYDNGDTEKRLIRFMEPADVKGVGLLTYDYRLKDDDIWLYMPALRKTRRIISSEKAKNFMGSEFTYADMTPPALEDFKFTNLGEEMVNGVLCYKIEWLPATDDIAEENGFSKRIAFIGKQDFVLRRSLYYDRDGELYKELLIHEIKELDTVTHRFRAVSLEMVNLQNDRKSFLVNESLEFNPDIADDYFTTRYLERE